MAKHAAFERLLGKFPLKAPRQKALFADRGFVNGIYVSEDDQSKAAKAFGLTPAHADGDSGVWYCFKGFVGSHVDGFGVAMVYLAKGSGTIGIMNGSKIEERRIDKGEAFLFDDRKRHFWACNTDCQMFVLNVKKPANHTASGLKPSR